MTIRQKIRRAAIVGSFALFPVTLYYFSPVLSLQAISVGIVSGSLVIFGALFAVSLFFGRVFCGWACPGAGLQEIVALVRGAPVKRTRINWIKWVVWGPWAATLLFLALRAGGVRVIDFTYQTRHGVSVTDLPGAIALATVLLVFLVPALAVGRRAACHTICWMAPFMILGRKARNLLGWPALRLTLSTEPCRRCGSCSRACPMSIEVEALVRKKEMECADCILCGSCVDSCPRSVIRFSFSPGGGEENKDFITQTYGWDSATSQDQNASVLTNGLRGQQGAPLSGSDNAISVEDSRVAVNTVHSPLAGM